MFLNFCEVYPKKRQAESSSVEACNIIT